MGASTDEFGVVVSVGTLRSTAAEVISMPHRWFEDGAAVQATFTGAHLLHLSVAACVLNDICREGEAIGVSVRGARVTASGGFDTTNWTSTGVRYAAEIDADAPADAVARLLARVDEVAEIPRAIRAGADVRNVT